MPDHCYCIGEGCGLRTSLPDLALPEDALTASIWIEWGGKTRYQNHGAGQYGHGRHEHSAVHRKHMLASGLVRFTCNCSNDGCSSQAGDYTQQLRGTRVAPLMCNASCFPTAVGFRALMGVPIFFPCICRRMPSDTATPPHQKWQLRGTVFAPFRAPTQ